MKYIVSLVLFSLVACDETMPWLCNVDRDCTEDSTDSTRVCYEGVCMAGSGGDASASDAGLEQAGTGTDGGLGDAGDGGVQRDAGLQDAGADGGSDDPRDGGDAGLQDASADAGFGDVMDGGDGVRGDAGLQDAGVDGRVADAGQCSTSSDCPQSFICTSAVCHWDWDWANWPVSTTKSHATGAYSVTAETVRDNVTGLVWQRGTSATGMTWDAARAYCASLELAGGGWRLPSIIELLSIVDSRRTGPSIDTAAFSIGTDNGWFWTSTPIAGSSDAAWIVTFYSGTAYDESLKESLWVRCVR
jgi:hypothetical protein